jgi:hypothetical protein
VKILRALIPALEKRPGTPVLINDVVLPELNSKERYKERIMRQTDIAMFVVLGAKQRSATQFHALVKEADQRFEVRYCTKWITLCSELLLTAASDQENPWHSSYWAC